MKTIVSHMSPDLDSIGAAWLIHRYFPDWDNAEIAFVPAGTSLDNKPPDQDPNILHVDTGLGKFDHHQFNDRSLCATKLVFNHIEKKGYAKGVELQALSRIAKFVTLIDSFGEAYFPNAAADIYDFCLYQLIEGVKTTGKSNLDTCELTFSLLDGVLNIFKNKVRAEDEIKQGLVFQTKWGKTIALETKNDQVVKLAIKMGYDMAVKKSPEQGFLRVSCRPTNELDLTPIYEEFKKYDPQASWFLHSSKNLLINGSVKNPTAVPSSLSLQRVIEIIKKIA